MKPWHWIVAGILLVLGTGLWSAHRASERTRSAMLAGWAADSAGWAVRDSVSRANHLAALDAALRVAGEQQRVADSLAVLARKRAQDASDAGRQADTLRRALGAATGALDSLATYPALVAAVEGERDQWRGVAETAGQEVDALRVQTGALRGVIRSDSVRIAELERRPAVVRWDTVRVGGRRCGAVLGVVAGIRSGVGIGYGCRIG